jgi:hypothetical protein
MAGMSIDRMVIDAPGLSEEEGRRLAHLIAERLNTAAARIDRPISQPSVEVVLPGGAAGGIDLLAMRIVEDLLRRIGCTV